MSPRKSLREMKVGWLVIPVCCTVHICYYVISSYFSSFIIKLNLILIWDVIISILLPGYHKCSYLTRKVWTMLICMITVWNIQNTVLPECHIMLIPWTSRWGRHCQQPCWKTYQTRIEPGGDSSYCPIQLTGKLMHLQIYLLNRWRDYLTNQSMPSLYWIAYFWWCKISVILKWL